MEFQYEGDGMGGLASLAVLMGLIGTIFWMVVGWRAMAAHERIASSLQKMAATSENEGSENE